MADTITLRPGGQEYIHWDAVGLPDPPVGAIQASIDGGETWHACDLDGATVRLLVAHPSLEAPDPLAAVAAVGFREMLVRLADTPELVIRPGGRLYAPPAPA